MFPPPSLILFCASEHVPEMVDVVFLFDGSNSVSRRDLEQIKKFMLRTMEEADAGMQFAIVQYSALVRTEMSFKMFQAQRENLREIVNDIQLMESSTFTATGINFTINSVFTEEAGAREGAKKVVIVITDGATTPGDISLTEVIKNAQEKGIFRIAIGVGDSFEKGSRGLSELTTIASCTRCLIKIKDYSDLHSVLQDFQSKIDTIDECTAEMVDVVFLFDGSNSLTKRDLEANKKFMLNMMQASGANTQFAIAQYSLYSRTEMNFTTFRTQPGNLREIVNNIQLMESLTFTATGINFTIENVFTEEAGAREGAARLLVLITDGQPTPGDIDLNQVVARAQEKQILRFVIRIGSSIEADGREQQQLRTIASCPDTLAILRRYDDLPSVLEKLKETIGSFQGCDFGRRHICRTFPTEEEIDVHRAPRRYSGSVQVDTLAHCFVFLCHKRFIW
ncbi:cartilage matrix protein-like [Mobula birostris]|uniref:cartilage matrix protein-like n=1 Tax=Mobula birostris TaxID=1983395 RepID=UPI003B27E3FD